MHEFTFSDVSCPDRQVILQLPLRDFCIGHRLILLKQRNPLLWQDEAGFNELPFEQQVFSLIEAVYTCAQTYGFRKRLEARLVGWVELRWHHFKVAAWHRRRKREEPAGVEEREAYWAAEVAKFRNYINAARIETEFDAKRDGFPFMPVVSNPDSQGRSLGGPYDAALIQFLVSARLCAGEAAALEYPLALAQAHFLAHLEREGNLRILNAFEMEFEEESSRLDLVEAKQAGFQTVTEYKADLLAKARAAKSAREAAVPEVKA